MTKTARCDLCWELEKRIEADPEGARRILSRVLTEFTTMPKGEGHPYQVLARVNTEALVKLIDRESAFIELFYEAGCPVAVSRAAKEAFDRREQYLRRLRKIAMRGDDAEG